MGRGSLCPTSIHNVSDSHRQRLPHVLPDRCGIREAGNEEHLVGNIPTSPSGLLPKASLDTLSDIQHRYSRTQKGGVWNLARGAYVCPELREPASPTPASRNENGKLEPNKHPRIY